MSGQLQPEGRGLRTTVIGAGGFIGRHVVAALAADECFAPARNDPALFREPLGHVVYCAGVSSDFRKRPYDTMRAHVGHLADLLERADFESFVYVSSTRVYLGCDNADEQSALRVDLREPDHLFHLSKLAGESLCLHGGRQGVRIARLSNVLGDDYSSGNFVFALIRSAVERGAIALESAPDSAKDYIAVGDVARLLVRIAREGASPIYNVASGINTTAGAVAELIRERTGCSVSVLPGAPTVRFPPIGTGRIAAEFGFRSRPIAGLIHELIDLYVARCKRKEEEP
ncbi:NAD-dependent epimerase/dehydratase family protein [Paenibacillus cymbidii]|uniref:NAD-dependent epimerase/dehydratase family protein n=1 Tax=Paenibacillus cymbidii TaxID=1639034 RepID=UPI001436C85C|nr:SDR family oxidoreductase [Paenibacillus cymbidii]